jgi:hypothetical protein
VVDDRWGIVMDEAWARFYKNPPTRLRVQIKDAPGDAEARESGFGRRRPGDARRADFDNKLTRQVKSIRTSCALRARRWS